jgi:acid phosphatase
MKIQVFLFLLFGMIGLQAQSTLPRPDHIVVVIEENHAYTQIAGSSAAPYINQLISDSKCASFTNFKAETHPSQPNYIILFSGANQGVTNDNLPSGTPFTTENLGHSLINGGFTFAGYSEDLPSVGYNGTTSGLYARKHNPWVNWQAAGTNGVPSSVNQPLSAFPTDFTKLPTVSFIIPNLGNDMHNGTDPTTITTGDTWLKTNCDAYIQWAKTHNSLFILTWDEDDNTTTNQILTLLVGQQVQHGSYSQQVNHINLLRTIEDMYHINHSGTSASASPIDFCWTVVSDIKTPPLRSGYSLEQNYPNPFNPSTVITYAIPTQEKVQLTVFDLLGHEVGNLVNEVKLPGTYAAEFKPQNLPSGVYFYRLQAGNQVMSKKLIYMK